MVFFSKSFGYALRGILYTANEAEKRPRTQVDEIARELCVPKHFLSKIMKKLVKHGILDSTKGPYGGFSINHNTLTTPLLQLMAIIDGDPRFDQCMLRLTRCNSENPCPLHFQMETYKHGMQELFSTTTIGDLLRKDNPKFIKSIAGE